MFTRLGIAVCMTVLVGGLAPAAMAAESPTELVTVWENVWDDAGKVDVVAADSKQVAYSDVQWTNIGNGSGSVAGCCDTSYQPVDIQGPACNEVPDASLCFGMFFPGATCDAEQGCITEEPVCCAGLDTGFCYYFNESSNLPNGAIPESCVTPCLGDYQCPGGFCDTYQEVCNSLGANDKDVARGGLCTDTVHPQKCRDMGGFPQPGLTCNPQSGGCEELPPSEPASFCCACPGPNPFPNACFEATSPDACNAAGCEAVEGGSCNPVTELCDVEEVPVCGDGQVTGAEECDPGNPVQGDCCTDTCEFAAVESSCDLDDEFCTLDTCNASGVCVAGTDASNGTQCSEGDLCTLPGTCQDGVCSGGGVNCDDGFACTIDSCNPVVGCLNVATEESRDCPGSSTDGFNNDPADDDFVDYEDTGCASLAELGRFGIIGTKNRMHSDLKIGTNVTVASTEVNGSCNVGTSTCDCPVVNCDPEVMVCTTNADCPTGTCNVGTGKCECELPCPVDGDSCGGDSDCLYEVAGTCGGSGLCECPAEAPNCQALNRPCSDDSACAIPPFPTGSSVGGVCGNGMLISAGAKMGVLASNTTSEKLQFGTAESGNSLRQLDITDEFCNAGGTIQLGDPAPFLGPIVCSNNTSLVCSDDADCGAGTCDARRRLLDGSAYESFNGVPDAGLAGAGSSFNFKLCDVAMTELETFGPSNPSDLQAAIEAFTPDPGDVVTLGAANCLRCPLVDSADGACTACPNGFNSIRTNSGMKKVIITVGSGLQVLDLRRIIVSGKTRLVIRGQADTELLVRVERQIRAGAAAKVMLEGMTSDQVLYVAEGRFGGKPSVSRDATWRGSILAAERGGGIFLGGTSYLEGGIYSRKILVKGPDTTIQHFPWKGKLPNVP